MTHLCLRYNKGVTHLSQCQVKYMYALCETTIVQYEFQAPSVKTSMVSITLYCPLPIVCASNLNGYTAKRFANMKVFTYSDDKRICILRDY